MSADNFCDRVGKICTVSEYNGSDCFNERKCEITDYLQVGGKHILIGKNLDTHDRVYFKYNKYMKVFMLSEINDEGKIKFKEPFGGW